MASVIKTNEVQEAVKFSNTEAHLAPSDQNVLIFMQFSGKIGQMVGWRLLMGWRPLCQILDLPLQYVKFYLTAKCATAAVITSIPA